MGVTVAGDLPLMQIARKRVNEESGLPGKKDGNQRHEVIASSRHGTRMNIKDINNTSSKQVTEFI